MSNTPEADALRQLYTEGLNPQAVMDLADMVLQEIMASMPEHFDPTGRP